MSSGRVQTDWASVDIPTPSFTGLRTIEDMDLSVLRDYIDWSPFFMTWQLIGKYPRIFEDEQIGEEARKLFKDANTLLDRIISEKLLTAKGVYGFWPASSEADDIVINSPDREGGDLATNSPSLTVGSSGITFPMLRQQWERKGQKDFRSLADYIAPIESGKADYLGAFAVTAGHGTDEFVKEFMAQHDDYGAIMTKALADRFAEAFAERLHQHVRTTLWGYAPGEQLTNEALIKEEYRGIRPAPGYPACPDHSLKPILFDLLAAGENAGLVLTESFAMLPTAAVSGFYFGHPESQYFGVARIGSDQLEDYARRRGVDLETATRWLRPNLD